MWLQPIVLNPMAVYLFSPKSCGKAENHLLRLIYCSMVVGLGPVEKTSCISPQQCSLSLSLQLKCLDTPFESILGFFMSTVFKLANLSVAWRQSTENRKQNIHKALLEEAKRQTVVDLMIQYYEEDAPDVFIHVLQKSNINDIAKKLEETLLKDLDAHQFQDSSDYRNYIKNLFATIKDPNAVPGEYVPLNQRYSNLIILDYHPSEEEREDEIMAIGKKHVETISKKAEFSTRIETLFNPDKYGLIPQVVFLQGAAGIGKTIMAKKIMFDWASQLLYQNKFDYAFYISCREMNLHAESQKTSIAEIISSEWLQSHKVNVIQNILKNEEKLLFIIDGFDELRYSFDQPEDYVCIDPWKKEPVRIILSSLFRKKLLPKSFLIITTRPMALEKLHQCLEHPRYFEILGFSTKERQEYFYKFFENKDQAMQAFKFVKQNDTLFTMCAIPLVSWIICTVMKQEMERGKDFQKTPYTLTAIYMLYFSSLLKFHHKEFKQEVQANIKGLCSLAAEGVWERKILFMEKEVKKHGLDQENFLPLFLNQSIFKRDIDCIQTFSFIHLSFQEFFAALFYVLEEREEQHSETQNKNLQTLLEKHKSCTPDFVVGFRFLFGFLNEEKRMAELKKEFGWEISPKNKEFLLDWVKYKMDKRICFHSQKDMLTYLYETQDDNFVKNALCGITKIVHQCNSDMELMILAYCVQRCQNLEDLHIESPTFPYQEEGELFVPNIELKQLKLSIKNTDDRAVELLFEGLQHPNCNVETVELIGKSVTKFCSRHLSEILKKNQRLRELQLCLYSPDDKVTKMLRGGLQRPGNRIEKLRSAEHVATELCRWHLVEVLRENQRLIQLALVLINPDDTVVKMLCDGLQHPGCRVENLEDNRGMEMLCKGLKHPDCKVEILRIHGEFLTKSFGRHITGIVRTNQALHK
ncbi:NACHT, LRR and PYD domains-containing protein 3, partial [Ophiophagus hannah]